ncbi:MAG TPA: arylesterase [bacterium]|jgi:acyl-CoA thioesterase-1|nr:arylesterase [bacterium]
MNRAPFQLRPWALALGVAWAMAAPLTAGAPPAPKALLCLGDSLTAAYQLDEAQGWPALLDQRLQKDLPGWKVVNAGASGDTSGEALRRLDWLLRSHPRAAFVCLGANDGLRGLPLAVLDRDLTKIVRRLKASGASVYLAGMDLPTNFGADYRRDFKALYPALAAREGVDLMPFLLQGVAGQPELNLSDGLHPNAAGQRLVAASVEAFLLGRLRPLGALGKHAEPAKVLRRREDLEQTP